MGNVARTRKRNRAKHKHGKQYMNKYFPAPLLIKSTLLIIAMLSASVANAVQIKVAVDRNPISINDSFQLTFTASESPDDDPDFSSLKQDFEILNQQQSSNSSWIKGSFSKRIQWTLNIMAKRTGKLKIPAIAFGDDATQPLAIEVTESNAKTNIDDELFLQVEAMPEKPYVQTQVLYTLRFFRRVQISKASLNEPELDNAVIEKLGEDRNYTTQINGVDYSVTERKYAIFPQQSGSATIAPLVLTANVINNQRPRFSGVFSSRISKPKRVKSRAISLDVQAAPQNFTAPHWLGAEQVYIEEKWSDDSLKVKVGEPLTRTLTLLAKGATVGQLPELGSQSVNELLKTYPDQPILKEQKTTEGVIAFREEKIAFIPSRTGDYILPAIEIPWFNTQTQQIEVAHIPEVSIKATAATGTSATASPTTETQISMEQPVQQSENNPFWMWLSLLLATGWILTVLFFLKQRLNKAEEKTLDKKQVRIKDTVKALKKACAGNNPQATKQALLQWGQIQFGATSLAAITPFCEARLRDEINLLNEYLYSAEKSSWQGKRLFQTFAENNARQQIKQPKDDVLEPLYRT